VTADGSAPQPRVVVSRALGLGDLCAAVPALRAIRAAFPNHELVLCAAGWQAPLARLAHVDRVSPTLPLDAIPERELVPDVAINLHGRGPQSTQRLLDLAPRRLIAFRHPVIPETEHAPRWTFDEHEVVRWCRLLDAYGIHADPAATRLERPDVAAPIEPGAVIVHPGAAALGRRWPPQRFAAVIRRLVSRGERVVITGERGEAELAAQVAALAGGEGQAAIVDLAGRTRIDELCALVADARALISNDTGVAHLATAYRTPSVVLFGPTSPARWGPLEGPHATLWTGGAGDPHAAELHPGLAAITVEQVMQAFDAITAGPGAGRYQSPAEITTGSGQSGLAARAVPVPPQRPRDPCGRRSRPTA
jgi:ADP-heptose:LPS heptosyltransferase